MNVKLKVVIASALIAVATQMACAASQDKKDLSRAEIRKMVREAHTADQYRTLAAYFRDRQETLDQSARKEREEWEQEASGTTFSVAAKYPRPVDASRNRYEYLSAKAFEMSQKASYYEGLASVADKSGQ
jgi:hypothetical protein